tara:strand:- start:986 stop:1261 length:276 start_codon:yes stop_codon:yes gene_type:complete
MWVDFGFNNQKKRGSMKIDDYRFDVVSIDIDSINQHFIDNEDNQGLKKLEKLSKGELENLMWKVDDMFSNIRAELWSDFIYEVCEKIKEKK